MSLLAALILGFVGCGKSSTEDEVAAPRPDFAALLDPASVDIPDGFLEIGKNAYTQACYACHGGDGMGMPGMQPALYGSEKLASDPYYVIEWVLRGSAMLGGQKSQWPVIMPGHKHLSDKEIAAIISYTRSEFGAGASGVSPEMVKLVRDAL
ncbi:MAG: c-type cytochrome [Opitutales bacterium]